MSLSTRLLSALFGLACAAQAGAEDWALEGAASSVTLALSAEGGTALAATFADLSGGIAPDGAARVTVALDSLDTGSALQDARLRFLLLETFRAPQGGIVLDIRSDQVADLPPGAARSIAVPVTVSLNGRDREVLTDVTLSGLSEDIVAIKSVEPLRLQMADVGLAEGQALLSQATGSAIAAHMDLSFDLVMRQAAASVPAADAATLKACARRIATIAQSDQVYFTSGSSALEAKSFPLLDAIADTMTSCPEISLRIEGHTDNVGPAGYNKALSIDRAGEVMTYLALRDIAPERLGAMGFGEDNPIADNDTPKGRWKNRRIEFVVFSRDGTTRIKWKD